MVGLMRVPNVIHMYVLATKWIFTVLGLVRSWKRAAAVVGLVVES